MLIVMIIGLLCFSVLTIPVRAASTVVITVSPSQLSIQAGHSAYLTVLVDSTYNFDVDVTLYFVDVSPPFAPPMPFTYSFSPSTIHLAPGGHGSSQLKITIGADATPGGYWSGPYYFPYHFTIVGGAVAYGGGVYQYVESGNILIAVLPLTTCDLVLASSPINNVEVTVGSSIYYTPCTLGFGLGTQLTISVPTSVSAQLEGSDQMITYDFVKWSDDIGFSSLSSTITYTVPSKPSATLTAEFARAQMPVATEARGVFTIFSAERDPIWPLNDFVYLFTGTTDASGQVDKTLAKQRIDKLVDDSRQYNVNTIFVGLKNAVKGKSGVLCYNTAQYPMMRYQNFTDLYEENWDPMEYLIQQCHDENLGSRIEVHVAFAVFTDSMLIDHKLELGILEEIRQASVQLTNEFPYLIITYSPEYVEPRSLAVQLYEFAVINEIVSKYDIDGINLDYIRYDEPTTFKTPAAVVGFVAMVSSWLRLFHPTMILSADVWPDGQQFDLDHYGQDIGAIASMVDVLMPMAYTRFAGRTKEPAWVKEVVESYTRDYKPRYIVPCIEAWNQYNDPNFSYKNVVNEVNAARDGGADGFALFTYESAVTWFKDISALGEILEGYSGVPWASTSASAIRIKANSPVNTLVTAPNGLRVGYDSSTHTVVNEIEGATYSGPGTEPQVTRIPEPLPGDYKIDVFGVGTGSYAITVESIAPDGSVIDTRTWTGETYPEKLESNSVPLLKDGNLRDLVPPWTTLSIGLPQFVDSTNSRYVTSETPFDLTPFDNLGGEGVASTTYRIYNTTYSSDWIIYSQLFHLAGLTDGPYQINYYSSDNAGNVEPTKTTTVILDNTAPEITDTNFEGLALQDGVTLEVSAWDLSAVASVTFTIQCTQGETVASGPGTPLPGGKWAWYFNTTPHPDGPYIAIITTTDVLGSSGDHYPPIEFTIRNWAAIELLPASERNQPGRTMPVKFSLRIIESVDPAKPFVRNEELTIKIYALDDPANILQTSTYGDTARDYRIDAVDELYITNFKTLKTAKTYRVEIYRKGVLIGYFEFSTYNARGGTAGIRR